MALFGNSSSAHRLPEYRVAALAQLDLEERMRELPMIIERPGHIEWMVNEDEEGKLVAQGAIRIPIQIVFDPSTEEGADPTVERVIINGKRKYDARAEEKELHDLNYGMDVERARIESLVRYRTNMKS